MDIRLVIFDLDETIWDHPDVSSLKPPFKRVNFDVIEDSNGKKVQLYDGVRETMEKLSNRGILLSTASWNMTDIAKQILELFEIYKYFSHPKIEFHPNKHLMIKDMIEDLEKEGIHIRPQEILYIDDQTRHLQQIRKTVGGIKFLQMWADLKDPKKLLTLVGR